MIDDSDNTLHAPEFSIRTAMYIFDYGDVPGIAKIRVSVRQSALDLFSKPWKTWDPVFRLSLIHI